MFKPVESKVSFPNLEQEVLAFWQQNAIFRRSIDERPEDKMFIFYEGPPTANARPGIHHVLSRVFKDLVPRYKTMQGFRVPRKGGWDTHGLPVELEVEKELGLKSKPEIEQYGIAAFNAKCKESVSRYVEEWTRLSERIAFWADYENPYVTYSNDYIETCWWIFKQMWDHGLVYQDYRVTPHCPRCGTSLSDHEVSLGYQDDTPDPSVFVKFRVPDESLFKRGHPRGMAFGNKLHLVAWTTTPWTLPGNTALAVKEDAEYGAYRVGDEVLVMAQSLAPRVLGEDATPLMTLPAAMLIGLEYEPLYRPELLGHEFGWFDGDGRLQMTKSGTPGAPETDGRRKVVAADYVSLEDGSGIVHIAPAFGAEDFAEGKHFGLLFMQPVDLRGIMAEGLPGAGKFAKQADRDVERDLEERGLMLKKSTIKHTYPFCWRCTTPLLYYAKPSWYIRTTKQKESLLEGNSRINWYPEHIKSGRFGNWLENNIDWAVSRERYWGTPLPFWKCADCAHPMCCGSKAEIIEHAKDQAKAAAMDDYHRPFIDEIVLRCEKCGGDARRVPEVADAWYDSGAMPYAQWHYPFENEDEFLKHFPADFICEAIDQTRGWFYTLHAEATMLKASEAIPESISYKNVICLGHINDEKGNKMSKSRGNTVDPFAVLDALGADATRWYMYTASPAGSSRRFSQALVEEGLRRFLLTLWNTYSFFVSYANIDGYKPGTEFKGKRPEIDRWLLSELNALVVKVTDELEGFDPTDAARAIETFVDDLSNWYVRRSRRRFWRGASEGDDDKQSAYDTLYMALVTVSKLIAPFTPFVAEELYRNLVVSQDPAAPVSVHLAMWPGADPTLIDESLNAETQLVKRVCSLGRAARAKAQIKVRQPVAEVLVKPRSPEEAGALRKNLNLVLEELNAKSVRLVDDETVVVSYDVKPNLPVLGKKYGSEVAAIRAGLAVLPPAEVAEAVRRGSSIAVAGKTLEPEDILLQAQDSPGFAAAQDAGYTVAVTTTITPELADEGLARELVRRIQDMRREAGFELADRITTWVSGPGDVARVLASHGDYIRGETLSTELIQGPAPAEASQAEADLEGTKVALGVRKN
ncbi:isoleucine--tRNA ligase [Candidatus Amarobacter glycogenicus]|uniref:isoleucine--tRNA ligase n=1 Tax=Candidatus Amarobacter glycogenicus TaxID=3140699 RepID=UPI003135E8C5|nr:isoleucine--tRNA ligase [Dehalococcoidia bacterium]